MNQPLSGLTKLFSRWRTGEATAEERLELFALMRDPVYEEEVRNFLGDEIEQIPGDMEESVSEEKATQLFADVMAGIRRVEVIPMRSGGRRWKTWGWTAAAALIIALAGAYLIKHTVKGVAPMPVGVIRHDALPGANKAVLTLGDGRKIILDNTEKNFTVQQGKVSTLNDSGLLAYTQHGTESVVTYNTIVVPRGGVYQLVLSDGTRVWLNSASSLRYPTAFTGKERRVELTGEGYFEVAHQAGASFHVKAGGVDVEDIGTSFNINAYPDEPVVRATLVEGRAKCSLENVAGAGGPSSVFLQPGDQAVADGMKTEKGSSAIKILSNVSVDEAMAWKNGFFDFEKADLHSIMRQIGRWYDLDIEYKGILPERQFRARMSRNTHASEVLRILEATNIHFTIEGNKLTVIP